MATVQVQGNIPEGFQVYGQETICYVSSDGKTLYMDRPIKKIMITSESDLTNLPNDLPIGSEAFLADESKKYRLDADGTWQEIGAASAQQQQQAGEG